MMMSDYLVYYDTNVWISWMLGSTDRIFKSAKRLIDDVIHGKKRVVISYMVILETIHTLHRKITEGHKYMNNRNDVDHTQIKKKIKEHTDKFLSLIYNLVKNRHAYLIESNISITDHHVSVLQKMRDYLGHIRATSPNSKKYTYHGLGHADLEHVFLAKICNVKYFYSGDHAFEHLDNDEDFKEMHFEIIR